MVVGTRYQVERHRLSMVERNKKHRGGSACFLHPSSFGATSAPSKRCDGRTAPFSDKFDESFTGTRTVRVDDSSTRRTRNSILRFAAADPSQSSMMRFSRVRHKNHRSSSLFSKVWNMKTSHSSLNFSKHQRQLVAQNKDR